jgi:4-phosphopantoate--beta-alanine ligase
MRTRIPRDHPRYRSLVTRERMKDALARGLIHPTGLIAHGRGEAFDYLLGERTPPEATEAVTEAARLLRDAKHPVLSLNGNVVALAAAACLDVAKARPGLVLEVNLFHRTPQRVAALVAAMQVAGAKPGQVLGEKPDFRIPGLASDRAQCCKAGIGDADVVLVPLEDGDRCQALKAMGKTVVTIDLNPLSRTAQAADVTIVDELTRAMPALARALRASPRKGGGSDPGKSTPVAAFDNQAVLRRVKSRMTQRLSHQSGQT